MGCAWQLQEVLHEGLERLSPAVNKKVAESPHAALRTDEKDRLQAPNRESITKGTAISLTVPDGIDGSCNDGLPSRALGTLPEQDLSCAWS